MCLRQSGTQGFPGNTGCYPNQVGPEGVTQQWGHGQSTGWECGTLVSQLTAEPDRALIRKAPFPVRKVVSHPHPHHQGTSARCPTPESAWWLRFRQGGTFKEGALDEVTPG